MTYSCLPGQDNVIPEITFTTWLTWWIENRIHCYFLSHGWTPWQCSQGVGGWDVASKSLPCREETTAQFLSSVQFLSSAVGPAVAQPPLGLGFLHPCHSKRGTEKCRANGWAQKIPMSVWFSQSRCRGERSGEGLGLAMSKRERGKLFPLILEGSSGEREGQDKTWGLSHSSKMSAQMTAPGQEDLQPSTGLVQDCTGMENVQKAQPPLEASILPEQSHFPISLTPLFLGPKVEELFLHSHALLLARFNSCLVRDRLLAVMWSQGQRTVEVSRRRSSRKHSCQFKGKFLQTLEWRKSEPGGKSLGSLKPSCAKSTAVSHSPEPAGGWWGELAHALHLEHCSTLLPFCKQKQGDLSALWNKVQFQMSPFLPQTGSLDLKLISYHCSCRDAHSTRLWAGPPAAPSWCRAAWRSLQSHWSHAVSNSHRYKIAAPQGRSRGSCKPGGLEHATLLALEGWCWAPFLLHTHS